MSTVLAAHNAQRSRTFPYLRDQLVAADPLPDAPNAWDGLPTARLHTEKLRENRIVSADQTEPASEIFDMLRTNVFRRLQQNKWTSIAITSPSAGCGSSLVAVNLAFSLARQEDCRVVLVDLNLRQPHLADLMGLDETRTLEEALSGDTPIAQAVLRCSPNLGVLATSHAVPNPAELLQSARIGEAIDALQQQLSPHVILYDMAPLRPHDDTLAFLPKADCALLVAEAEETTFEQVDLCEFEISQATSLLGIVLNKCRFTADPLLVGNQQASRKG